MRPDFGIGLWQESTRLCPWTAPFLDLASARSLSLSHSLRIKLILEFVYRRLNCAPLIRLHSRFSNTFQTNNSCWSQSTLFKLLWPIYDSQNPTSIYLFSLNTCASRLNGVRYPIEAIIRLFWNEFGITNCKKKKKSTRFDLNFTWYSVPVSRLKICPTAYTSKALTHSFSLVRNEFANVNWNV